MSTSSILRISLACVLLAALAGCASGPQEPLRDPFLIEIEAAEEALDAGDLPLAQSHLDKALPIASMRGRRSEEQGRVQLGLARLHRLMGDSRARHHLALARFATRASVGDTSLAMANVEFESSLQHQAADSLGQGVDALREALRIRESILPRDAPELAETLSALGFATQLTAEYPEAVRVIERTLAALEAWPVSAERTHLELVNRNRLAWVYSRASLTELAEQQRILAHETWMAENSSASETPKAMVGLAGLREDTSLEREQMRGLADFARKWVVDRRIAEKHFSFEQLLLSARSRLDRGASLKHSRSALEDDLMTAFLAFAPARAKPSRGDRYQLPFPLTAARRVTEENQAHGYEHVYLHAVDFEMPAGSPVLAARGGVVARVITGFPASSSGEPGQGGDPSHGDFVNRVMVLHDDGTYATYSPLAPGIHIWEGLTIATGDQLGETARTGSRTPILHFDVRRNIKGARKLAAEPVRVAFHGVSQRDGVPLAGHFYGGEEGSQPAARGYSAH